jgi:hypothetical protein
MNFLSPKFDIKILTIVFVLISFLLLIHFRNINYYFQTIEGRIILLSLILLLTFYEPIAGLTSVIILIGLHINTDINKLDIEGMDTISKNDDKNSKSDGKSDSKSDSKSDGKTDGKTDSKTDSKKMNLELSKTASKSSENKKTDSKIPEPMSIQSKIDNIASVLKEHPDTNSNDTKDKKEHTEGYQNMGKSTRSDILNAEEYIRSKPSNSMSNSYIKEYNNPLPNFPVSQDFAGLSFY